MASVRQGRSLCLDPCPCLPVLHAAWSHTVPQIHLLCSHPLDPTCHHSPRHWQARARGRAAGSHQKGPGIASFVNAPVGTVQSKGCKETGETNRKPAARETGEDGVSKQGQGFLEVEWTGCTISTAVSQEPPHHLILACCCCHGSLPPLSPLALSCSSLSQQQAAWFWPALG